MNPKTNLQEEKEDGVKIYKIIASLFAVLSLVNIAAVIFTFRYSGNNLFYAEEAVSHVAKIEQCLQSTNESVLNIVLNQNDSRIIQRENENINTMFDMLSQEEQEFKKLNLSSIDGSIMQDFDSAMTEVNYYEASLKEFQNHETNGLEEYYRKEISPLQEKATLAMQDVAERQSELTNAFFHKIAHRFLILLVFMLFLMALGLNSFTYMRKKIQQKNFENAQTRQTARANAYKASQALKKANAMAFTNVLTELKNRYALEEDLDEKLRTEDVTLAFFNFDNFQEVTQSYGRDFGDMFIINMTDMIKKDYSDKFEIYHTESGEFCFVANEASSPEDTDSMIAQLGRALSAPIEISKLNIQPVVSGCVYYYKSSEHLTPNSLLIKIDRALQEAKENSEHKIMKLQSIYSN
ncbi:MAG: diguanylate cyclase [Oscillospiraceae bacterium]|nr:diguanylate cyclase [Oscillospiraceae bacterium]